MHLCIAVVEDEVIYILWLGNLDHLLLVMLDREL